MLLENLQPITMTTKSIYSSFLIAVLGLLLSCKNEPAQQQVNAQETPAPVAETTTSNLPKLKKFKDGVLELVGGDPITLDSSESNTTIFLVPPSQTTGNSSSLSRLGLMQADMLSKVLEESQLEYIYCKGNPAMQTGTASVKVIKCDLGLIGQQDEMALAKFILHNYEGKKVLVVAPPSYLNAFLGILSTDYTKQPFSSDVYDEVYVVNAREIGNAEVLGFKF